MRIVNVYLGPVYTNIDKSRVSFGNTEPNDIPNSGYTFTAKQQAECIIETLQSTRVQRIAMIGATLISLSRWLSMPVYGHLVIDDTTRGCEVPNSPNL